ncbi:MAG: GGDEF domain-containing protein [Planctomycetes bacterium]|nr:GGDEF domain-containing protein [Planctomycetota bacterium]
MVIVVAVMVLIDRRHSRCSAVERARICAFALTPGPNGDLRDSFERLRRSYPNLLAVAPLAPNGTLQQILADDPTTVRVVRKVVENRQLATRWAYAVDGISVRAWAVTLPLNGDDELVSRQAVFVLSDESIGGFRRGLIAYAAASMFALVGVSGLLLTRWFEKHVASSLRRLATAAGGLRRPAADTTAANVEPWREWRTIAEHIQNASQRVQKCESDFRQAAYHIKQQLQRKEAHFDYKLRRAEDNALVDPLTGLRNRRFLEQELEPLVVSQRTRGKDLCGVMIDLDNFKRYNDSCGHQAGDELLRFVGELLTGTLRPQDHAIRVGGDEFLLLLPDVGPGEATKVVERMQRLFGQYTHLAGGAGRVSMSAGIATIRTNACVNGRELIAEADKALYHVKQNGKSAVRAARTVRDSRPVSRRLKPIRPVDTV